jgi:putrescine transport system ATP-binding protein
MAEVTLEQIGKTYPGGVEAVRGVNLRVADGELVVLVGPSGSGKTTLLRLIAGLETPTTGVLRIGDHVVNDVPPHRRDVAMVFQRPALYPHLSVWANLGFSLKLRRGVFWRRWLGRRRQKEDEKAEERILAVAGQLGLENVLERRPATLSGGQQQRVALGRALVRRPAVFLLDEPLSNLDARLRLDMRRELHLLHRRLRATMIYVTHDQDEAMALATRIAVMDRGQVAQVGTPGEIYEFPRSRFVADFVGTTNLFEGTVSSCEPGLIRVQCAETGGELLVDDGGSFTVGQRVWVALRPEKVRLGKQPTNGARTNQLRGVVWELGYLGNRSTYRIKTASGKLVTVFAQNERRSSEAAIDWSDEVFVSWSADAAVLLQS